MFSATDFLPRVMTTFMNFASSTFPNFGSGRISRLGTSRRRGMRRFLCSGSSRPPVAYGQATESFGRLSGLRLLGAVLRAGLLAVLDACCIERAADHVIVNARQVLDATAANQDHGVLLQVM